jgi:hypothetical protein
MHRFIQGGKMNEFHCTASFKIIRSRSLRQVDVYQTDLVRTQPRVHSGTSGLSLRRLSKSQNSFASRPL